MHASLSCGLIDGLASYAVIWNQAGETPIAGRLEVGVAGLDLHGGKRGSEHRVHVGYDEILGLGRCSERLAQHAAVRVEGREAGTLLIAALGGTGLNGEILQQLERALSSFA
jgi:hypothetical protein